ncbi:MAG TPA: antibiotic biosynthesis monooxygenase [Tepidiformaceae bacterium]|nr:antibiotic biosynthesis monooxygenase [Tepidiformaceae bacterium]HMO94576.1 antibiotic biosynthesis monooxygenase [Tepidiformaceae bacterium]
MAYVRVSIAKPRRGQEARLEELMRKLEAIIRAQPGCTASYLLKPHDDSGEIARIAIYENEDVAEDAANNQQIMALRSEIHLLVEPGHIERAFFSD